MLWSPSKLLLIYNYWNLGGFFVSEILIIGCGRNIQPVDPELRRFIRSTGMKLEAVDSVYMIALVYEILLCLALFTLLVLRYCVW